MVLNKTCPAAEGSAGTLGCILVCPHSIKHLRGNKPKEIPLSLPIVLFTVFVFAHSGSYFVHIGYFCQLKYMG